MHVKLIIFLSLLACFCTNKNTYKTPIDFNLITKSNLAYVYDFIGCKNANTIYDRTAFLQIKNNSIDTIFVDTYSYQNIIFLIAPYRRIRLYENHYLLEGSEPFYPPLILDTILPFQNNRQTQFGHGFYPFFRIIRVQPFIFQKQQPPVPRQAAQAYPEGQLPLAEAHTSKNAC